MKKTKLTKYLIAFDVDGTLRCSCTNTCPDPNEDIVQLVNILGKFKNTRIMIWSGGGKDYAAHIIAKFGLQRCFPDSKLDPETWVYGKPHIAIDDIHAFNMGEINLIVRQ